MFLFVAAFSAAMLQCSMNQVRAENNFLPPNNKLLLEALGQMPRGGGYSVASRANEALRNAVTASDGGLRVDPSRATPSYCSGATYLVLLKALSLLQSSGAVQLTPGAATALRPAGQPDGTGVWGRWNANGPGTARLFYELGLGPNFTDLSKALPGDFLKIFWNDGIGASEHGHSVIFLRTDRKDGVETVTFWSSNMPGGYGEKTVPRGRIRRMIFSRLEHPGAFAGLLSLPRSDAYLASLVHRSSTPEEMARQCGISR
jgi:hypothetical protein